MIYPCSVEMLHGCSHTSELTRCDMKPLIRFSTLLAQRFGRAQLANSWLQADLPAPKVSRLCLVLSPPTWG